MGLQDQWKHLRVALFEKQKMSNLLMGLSISDSDIACSVYSTAHSPTPHVITQGAVPYSKDKSLPDLLASLKHQHHLNRIKCCWTLCHHDYQLILTNRPKVLASEYRSVCMWQVKDMLEFPVDDCVVDVFLPAEGIESYQDKLYVVAARKSFLLTIVNLLNSMNITVESIITQEFAIRNVVANLNIGKDMAGVLTRDSDSYLLIIIQNNIILFSRRIFDDLAVELMRSLKYFHDKLKQKPFTTLWINDVSMEIQTSIRNQLAASNFDINILDIKTSHKMLGVEDEKEISRCFYSMGAALQFMMEEN